MSTTEELLAQVQKLVQERGGATVTRGVLGKNHHSETCTYVRVGWMPESREARGAVRWRQSTSHWAAYNKAKKTLVEYNVDPSEVPSTNVRELTVAEMYTRMLNDLK
jgi:hypothetical protein